VRTSCVEYPDNYDYYPGDYYDVCTDVILSSTERLESGDNECYVMQDFPIPIRDGTAAYIDDKLILCGGVSEGPNPDVCYELLSANDKWQPSLTLPNGPLYRHASSIIDGKWLLTGGYGNGDYQSSTIIYDNGIFTPGPVMPDYKHSHCQLTINSTHVIVVGGSSDTFLLNWSTQEWDVLPSAPFDRRNPACGLLNNPVNGPGKRPCFFATSFIVHDYLIMNKVTMFNVIFIKTFFLSRDFGCLRGGSILVFPY